VAVTPKPSPTPGSASNGTADDQNVYLVAAMIAIVGFVLLVVAGGLSVRRGGQGSV
jgi:hypothetical protein